MKVVAYTQCETVSKVDASTQSDYATDNKSIQCEDVFKADIGIQCVIVSTAHVSTQCGRVMSHTAVQCSVEHLFSPLVKFQMKYLLLELSKYKMMTN